MNKAVLFSLLFFSASLKAVPISPTNICWKCIFPIDIGAEGSPICSCGELLKGKTFGASVRFWDPAYVIDVTPTPYNFVALGAKIPSKTSSKRGYLSAGSRGGMYQGFFHVHLYRFPVLKMLGFLLDSDCLDSGDLHVAYISEMDPTWNDDALCMALFPDSNLVAFPQNQLACAADCAATVAKGAGLSSLHWCGGCQGSLYPLVGTVAGVRGAVHAASLLAHRSIARMHRTGFLRMRPKGNYCSSRYNPFPPKSDYRLQMISPVAERRSSHVLGASEIFWGAGKVAKDNDYSFILWTRRRCCLDIPTLASGVVGG